MTEGGTEIRPPYPWAKGDPPARLSYAGTQAHSDRTARPGRPPLPTMVAGESFARASPLNERTLDHAGDRVGCRTDPPSKVGISVPNTEADLKSGPIEARGPSKY